MQLLLLSQFFCRCLRVVPGWVGGLGDCLVRWLLVGLVNLADWVGGLAAGLVGGLWTRGMRCKKFLENTRGLLWRGFLAFAATRLPKNFSAHTHSPKACADCGWAFEYRMPGAEDQTPQARSAAWFVLPTHFGDFQLPNTALASVEYAQAAIKCIVNASKKQRRKATPSGLAAFGIQKRANQHCQATGEWVCDEKFWGRRALTMVERQKTPFARVFQKLFAAHTPSAALTSKASDFPPKAALAHHLGTFPPGAAPRHQINRTAAL